MSRFATLSNLLNNESNIHDSASQQDVLVLQGKRGASKGPCQVRYNNKLKTSCAELRWLSSLTAWWAQGTMVDSMAFSFFMDSRKNILVL